MNSTLQSCICIVEISDSLCIFGQFSLISEAGSGQSLSPRLFRECNPSPADRNNLRTELVTSKQAVSHRPSALSFIAVAESDC
jgi:hypothetical protein